MSYPHPSPRYMLFIKSTRVSNVDVRNEHSMKAPVQVTIQEHSPLPSRNSGSNCLQDACKENVVSHHNFSNVEGLSLSPSQIIRKEKSRGVVPQTKGRQVERRITLSPATAKAMLLSAVDENEMSSTLPEPPTLSAIPIVTAAPPSTMDMESVLESNLVLPPPPPSDGLSVLKSSRPIVVGKSSIDPQHMINDLGKELDGILANMDDVCSLNPIPRAAELQLVDDFLFDDTVSYHIAPSSPAKLPALDESIQPSKKGLLVSSDYSLDNDTTCVDVRKRKPRRDSIVLLEDLIDVADNMLDVKQEENVPELFHGDDLSMSIQSPSQPLWCSLMPLPADTNAEGIWLPSNEEQESTHFVPSAVLGDEDLKATPSISGGDSLPLTSLLEMYDCKEASKEEPLIGVFPDSMIDELSARERAFARMCERFEVARWKFQWEQISVRAANAAMLKK